MILRVHKIRARYLIYMV